MVSGLSSSPKLEWFRHSSNSCKGTLMTFSSRRKVRRQLSKRNGQTTARLRFAKATKLLLETLEDRVTPTAFSWNTSVLAGNWNTATNWSPNGIPGASDTVTFGGAPTGQVTVSLNGNEAASTVTFSNTAQS